MHSVKRNVRATSQESNCKYKCFQRGYFDRDVMTVRAGRQEALSTATVSQHPAALLLA